MAAAHDLHALVEQLGAGKLRLARAEQPSRALTLDWPELEAALPDGGLPRGVVVELSAPHALGGATSVALAAVHAAHARAPGAWCAWIDPEATLHAPGVVAAGVDLARLLVVRAPRALLGKVAVKLVVSGAFEIVVVDVDPPAGAASSSSAPHSKPPMGSGRRARGCAPELLVRKLALAAEPTGATVLLLTDASRPRTAPWPVALRLELSRPDARSLRVGVAKDRRGRVGLARTVPFRPVARLAG